MDLYSDPAFANLAAFLRERPGAVPFVKAAEFEDTRDAIPPTAFAWPAERRYPVHSAPHAVVSYLYATKTAGVPASVLREIETALDMYGVPVAALAPTEVKVAALGADDCLFPETQTYPVRTAGEVKTAEARLLDQLPRLTLDQRTQVFTKLARAAARHGVTLDAKSAAFAGQHHADRATLVLGLQARTARTGDPRYAKLAEAVKVDRAGLRRPATLAKLAGAIAAIDRQYPDRVRGDVDPVRLVYSGATKLGEPLVDLVDGTVGVGALAALPPSFFGDALGPEVVAEVTTGGAVDPGKVEAVLATLPADMKQALCRQLRAAGVPVNAP